MKKLITHISIILLSVCSLSTLTNCQDALDITQPGEITEDIVFTDVPHLKSYLDGSVYAKVEISNDIYLSAILSDEVKPGRGILTDPDMQIHRFYFDKSNETVAKIWLQHYTLIDRANRLLRGAEKIIPSSAETEQYNSILAQTRALRAFAYLQLETYFSEDMKNDNALGVMLIDKVASIDAQIPRSTNKEIFDFMQTDLDFSRKILKRGNDRYWVDLNFVDAVETRLNLYRGKYNEAKKTALNILHNSSLLLTPALPNQAKNSMEAVGSEEWNTKFYDTKSSFNPYRNLWNDSERGEIIFSLARQATGIGLPIGSFWNANISSTQGVGKWYMGRNLFNYISSTDGDIRRYAFIDPSSVIDSNYLQSISPSDSDKLVIDKYPGKLGATTRNDLKLFRLSEIYFTLAECAISENKLIEAASYIQAVRIARNYKNEATTPVYTNKQDALADVLKERRVELAFEGHRYIDLKRLASAAGLSMDRNITDDHIGSIHNLENNSYLYTFPIPLKEFSGNKNMQQNKGY